MAYDLQKVEDFLSATPFFSLATVDGDKPKVRPLAFHVFANEKLYFGVGEFKDVYKQMLANPYVEIDAVKEGEWLRYYGKAVFETDYAMADAILEERPALQKIYNDVSGLRFGIFHLEEATAEFRTKLDLIEKYSF